MPLGIIEPASRFAVLARGHRLASEQIGCPGAVVRLQTQFVVGFVRGQLLQPVRQSAAVEDPAGAVGRLPKAVDRHELLARISPLLSELAGAGIGFCCLDRSESFGRKQ